ncbi:MAG: HYR domain-containing protein, partial [Archangium sp.]
QFKVGTNLVTVSATDAAGNVSRCAFNVKVSPQYERGGCGCGAASLGDFSGGALLTALTFLAGRRRKSSAR